MSSETEPEPKTDTKEPLWKRENMRLGRLLVIASCPETGTLDREITQTTVFGQEVMSFLIVCRDQKVVLDILTFELQYFPALIRSAAHMRRSPGSAILP